MSVYGFTHSVCPITSGWKVSLNNKFTNFTKDQSEPVLSFGGYISTSAYFLGSIYKKKEQKQWVQLDISLSKPSLYSVGPTDEMHLHSFPSVSKVEIRKQSSSL